MFGVLFFMGIRNDLTGIRSGKLTVVSYFGNKNSRSHWNAKCDCGNEIVVSASNFTKGLSSSCGCNRKGHRTPNVDHPLYKVWLSMRDRCNNPNNEKYYRYGGRGIKVCLRWDNYEVFYSDVIEGYKRGLQLDRYPNNDGDYEPTNVRWATRTENMRHCSATKITQADVDDIRASKETNITLAERYGLCRSHIS